MVIMRQDLNPIFQTGSAASGFNLVKCYKYSV